MPDAAPRLYLVSPPELDDPALHRLAAVLDAHDVACLRLDLAGRDPGRVARMAEAARDLAAARDVPVVVTDHVALVRTVGLDGLHLTDPRPLRRLRKEWGGGPILGAFCGASRHDGMAAGEVGADYVAFGPVGTTPLGVGPRAELDLFAWWAEMIEVPVVAEGALDVPAIEALAPHVEFFTLGDEVWGAEDPVARLRALTAPLR